ncbi:MAG: hypothetical protein WBK26_16850 [Burkholderiaceae bacterium]
MKKAIAAALLGLALSAHAAGPYDGIYQNADGSQEWVSVQTNGNTAVATYYFVFSTNGVVYSTTIGNVIPSQANAWSLLQGSWNANTLNLSGQLNFNACAVNATAVFTSTGTAVTITNSQNTATGTRSGVNCSLMNNTRFQFNKIF